MIIQIDRPLTNDIRIGQPLANNNPDGPAFCKCSSFSSSVILLLCKIHIFLLQIFSSFSSTINLQKKNILSVSNSIPRFSFPISFSSEKNIFSFTNFPFPSPFYFSLAKKNSFSKYHPPFPSQQQLFYRNLPLDCLTN